MKGSEMVIAYHSVGECPIKEVGAGLYSVRFDRFKEQVNYLLNTQYTLHNTIITFDDGDRTNYSHAFPILKQAGLSAYFFIIGTKVGTDGYMDWPRIIEMHKAGMIIGSHGMTHRILTRLSDDELVYELEGSKKILEEKLGTKIASMSIPRGFYDERVMGMAKKAGYKKIFTSDARIVIKRGWTLSHFTKALEKGYLLSDKAQEMFKSSFINVLGVKNYDRIRSTILRPITYDL